MTGILGPGKHVRIHAPERAGDSILAVDGVDVTGLVSGFHVHGWDGDPGTTVTVTLNLPMVPVTEITAEQAHVVLSGQAEEMLAAAGWVRPGEAQRMNAVLDVARAWRHQTAMAVDLAAAVDTYEGRATSE